MIFIKNVFFKNLINKFLSELKYMFVKHEKGLFNGPLYATHLTRFISLLLDITILVYFAHFIGYAMRLVYYDMFMSYDIISKEIIAIDKFKFHLELTTEEGAIVKKVFIREIIAKFLQFFFTIISFLLFNYFFYKSPGKVVLKLSIVNDNDVTKRLSFKTMLKRYSYSIISVIVIFLGYFNCIWDIKARAWHDKLSGCAVVLRSSVKNNNK